MNNEETKTVDPAKDVVSAWVDYVEHFGNADISITELLYRGMAFEEITTMFHTAINTNQRLSSQMNSELDAQ